MSRQEGSKAAKIVRQARRIVSKGAVLIPLREAERIANGESPVKVLRQWRGKTQSDLSRRTRLSRGYISAIENGRREGTATSFAAIAKVLKVPADLLSPK